MRINQLFVLADPEKIIDQFGANGYHLGLDQSADVCSAIEFIAETVNNSNPFSDGEYLNDPIYIVNDNNGVSFYQNGSPWSPKNNNFNLACFTSLAVNTYKALEEAAFDDNLVAKYCFYILKVLFVSHYYIMPGLAEIFGGEEPYNQYGEFF